MAPQQTQSYSVRRYLTAGEGRDLFAAWLSDVRDQKAKVAILRRVNRLSLGNFGDCRPCREGVWELRLDVGPGYRVYYALAGQAVILLLCGRDKRTQDRDIDKACACWRDWCQRGGEAAKRGDRP
ncbi:type II toxin-antitoxin system RelE/ParE family toxin [uncultured Rhodospira sp.]|uniref:type II toxin-antitoxin system RelE/ParE family toxin n=1 Tax=uncultured Rhodospira sp. TaxID=1936189 RepID=UPI0026181378|nr:type II toxin-antitoxin system RelE/ParE family toxin [uncultured Rhodospira sp.]